LLALRVVSPLIRHVRFEDHRPLSHKSLTRLRFTSDVGRLSFRKGPFLYLSLMAGRRGLRALLFSQMGVVSSFLFLRGHARLHPRARAKTRPPFQSPKRCDSTPRTHCCPPVQLITTFSSQVKVLDQGLPLDPHIHCDFCSASYGTHWAPFIQLVPLDSSFSLCHL